MSIADYAHYMSMNSEYMTSFEQAVGHLSANGEIREELIATVRKFRDTAAPIMHADSAFADSILDLARENFDTGVYTICQNDPAEFARKNTSALSLMDTWTRSEVTIMTESVEDLFARTRTRENAFEHGFMDDIKDRIQGPRIRISQSVVIQMMYTIASFPASDETVGDGSVGNNGDGNAGDGNNGAGNNDTGNNDAGNNDDNDVAKHLIPFIMDAAPGHTKDKGSYSKDGNSKIDPGKMIAKKGVKRILAHSRTFICNGKMVTDVLSDVLKEDNGVQYSFAILSDDDLVDLCPDYEPMRRLRGMTAFNAVIIYDKVNKNTCFCATSLQLVSYSSSIPCLFLLISIISIKFDNRHLYLPIKAVLI